MSDITKRQVLVRRRRTNYKPVFRETTYQRNFFQRLTAFSWFLLTLVVIILLAGSGLAISRALAPRNQSMLFADWLAQFGYVPQALPAAAPMPTQLAVMRPTEPPAAAAAAAPTMLPTVTPAAVMTDTRKVTSTAQSGQTVATGKGQPVQPAATAASQPGNGATGGTVVSTGQGSGAPPNLGVILAAAGVGRAPWANLLRKMADGTLMAPQSVISKAVADLSGYYSLQRDLPLQDYLDTREGVLEQYFKGPAVDMMRNLDKSRKTYELRHSGTYTIEVRDFSPDGNTAVASVNKLNWVADVYDIASKQLQHKDAALKDSVLVMTVAYDKAADRWQYTSAETTGEAKP